MLVSGCNDSAIAASVCYQAQFPVGPKQSPRGQYTCLQNVTLPRRSNSFEGLQIILSLARIRTDLSLESPNDRRVCEVRNYS